MPDFTIVDLLEPDEAPPVRTINPSGTSPFLLIGDHAGNVVPRRLAGLGLPAADLARHIGWDIGIAKLGERLAARIDAAFIHQVYSRLVVDCNRAPDATDAMPAVSDATPVPGNAAIDRPARDARVAAIHAPYQQAVGDAVAQRQAAGHPTVLVALHSFTPAMGGVARPWQIGILHNGANDRFARAMLARLGQDERLTVGDNEPYRMDLIDYTVPRHAFAAGLPYAEIEIRQDLLGDDAGIGRWVDLLATALPAALAACG
ncbi:MAG: N-formylglutamate amidohydrolase [Janthinobacterium lividum]